MARGREDGGVGEEMVRGGESARGGWGWGGDCSPWWEDAGRRGGLGRGRRGRKGKGDLIWEESKRKEEKKKKEKKEKKRKIIF